MAEITGPFPLPGFVIDLASIASAAGHAQAAGEAAVAAGLAKEETEGLLGQAVQAVEDAQAAVNNPFGDETSIADLWSVWKKDGILTPVHFGGVGDGVTMDSAALNAALAALRAIVDARPNAAPTLDLLGRTWRTDVSLDGTGIVGWGWTIRNGHILAECEGDTALDMIGSRGGCLRDVMIEGVQGAMPRVGLMAARATDAQKYGFCDLMHYSRVQTRGWFGLAGVYCYGQESTAYHKCSWWNYNPDGYCGLHVGYDIEPVYSLYKTPASGAVSFIQNVYTSCEWRALPVGRIASVTGISKAAAAVVTAPGHPFVNGDVVSIGEVSGMTEINNRVGTVSSATADTFVLSGVNSSGFGTYTSGGQAVKAQTKPSIAFGRGNHHRFAGCYAVAYGMDPVRVAFPDAFALQEVTFDFLCEGHGQPAHFEFAAGSTARSITGFRLSNYQAAARDGICRNSGTGVVSLIGAEINIAGNKIGAPPLFEVPAKFALKGDVQIPVDAQFALASGFVGRRRVGSGAHVFYGTRLQDPLDGAWTPVVAAQTGAIGAYTVVSAQTRVYGGLRFVSISIQITNAGTGSNYLTITLPDAAKEIAFLSGRESGTGKMINGRVAKDSSSLAVRCADNSYPGGVGVIDLSGCYPIA